MRWICHLLVVLLLAGCSNQPDRSAETIRYTGQAMGTSYSVIFEGTTEEAVSQASVDSLLDALNESLSTYLTDSIISRVNASQDTSQGFALDGHFKRVMDRSIELHARSGGAFNPALGPLIDAWGFGSNGPGATPSDE